MPRFHIKKLPFIGLVMVALLAMAAVLSKAALAGPITNPGAAPYTKLAVYQGLITVVPGGAGNSILEIGHLGRHIAGTGDIWLRPGSLGPDETPGATNIRIYKNASNKASINVAGDLCIGGVCNSTWPGGGGSVTLDQVLANGNASTRGAALGQATAPSSKLVVNNGAPASAGSSLDAIDVYATSTGSALYAQQNDNTGWAGYFSGRVNIQGTLYINGRYIPSSLQVCQIGTNTCVGRYLYTTGTARDTSGQGVTFWYESPLGTIAPKQAYRQMNSRGCLDPTDEYTLREAAGRSYWSTSCFSGQEWVNFIDYKTDSVGPVTWGGRTDACIDIGSFVSGFKPQNVSAPGCVNNNLTASFYKVIAAIDNFTYAQDYELR